MKQLAPADSVALSAENPMLPQHIAVLAVLDTAEAPEFGFETLLESMRERVSRIPVYTSKLREIPFGLDHAYLVEDEHFDVRNHVHRSVVASPGGIRELSDLAARLFAPRLDRSKPLWEMWYIEGLADAKIALMIKNHHCLMDGVALSGLAAAFFDFQPEKPTAEPPAARPGFSFADDGKLSDLDVALRAAANTARRPLELAKLGARMLRSRLDRAPSPAAEEDAPPPGPPPFASFNGRPGWQRGLSCGSVAMGDVKQLKKRFRVTVNDVLLALGSGAVRHYLSARGQLPERELVVGVPVSQREADAMSDDNQFTFVPVAWGTHIANPAERLRHIHASATSGKQRARASSENLFASIGSILAPGAVHLLMRYVAPLGGDYSIPLSLNVSTVRATPFPLYVAGARIEEVYPLTVLQPSQGLSIAVVTYTDRAFFGFVHDPALVPEPWLLAEGLEKSMAELLSARLQRA
jgi:WS/DGAT/MGAT family acyltransferase